MVKKIYRRTPEGRAMRGWYNMNERSKKEGYEYSKGDVISKEEYLEMVKNSEVYKKMFDEWSKNNFSYGLTPTIDRIDSNKNYSKDNIQFLSFSDNARKNHDRENFRHIKGEDILKKERSENIMGKIASFLRNEAGYDNYETKEASFVDSGRTMEEFNSEFSKYNGKFDTIEHKVPECMAKTACFSLGMAPEIKINRTKLGNAIAERFEVLDKINIDHIYNDEEVKFIKTAYLSSCSEELSDEKIAQFVIINDKSFFGRNDMNYDFFVVNENTKEASLELDKEDDPSVDTILNDEVMEMIRNEFGEDVADGLVENKYNVYNALPLPHKQRIEEMYNSTQEGFKGASMMTTIGLGTLGSLIGRGGAFNTNKTKMDRADATVAGGAGGLLLGQTYDDYMDGKTNAEIIKEDNGILSMPGMEGLAIGSLAGYNSSKNNKAVGTIAGGLTGAALAEILRRAL